jgi:hypothetical protein
MLPRAFGILSIFVINIQYLEMVLYVGPLMLKHAVATKLASTQLFDSEPGNVHRLKSDFSMHEKNWFQE